MIMQEQKELANAKRLAEEQVRLNEEAWEVMAKHIEENDDAEDEHRIEMADCAFELQWRVSRDGAQVEVFTDDDEPHFGEGIAEARQYASSTSSSSSSNDADDVDGGRT